MNGILLNQLVLFNGVTRIQGLSSERPLIISGPAMFVQTSGEFIADNVIFTNSKFHPIGNRNWSGAINILESESKIGKISIIDSDAEDAINFVSGYVEAAELTIENTRSDAIDLDFVRGTFEKIICKNIEMIASILLKVLRKL